jgi:hypothetical protein
MLGRRVEGKFIMNNMFIVSVGLFIAFFMIANGLLLAFWPHRFLRFYDFWNRGDYVGKTASWRKNVEKVEYRLLGLGALVVGIAIIWDVFRVGGSPR